MPAERLHKAMAAAGVASRRKCEEIIAAGRVRVNGKVVREMGVKVDLSRDVIEVNGKKLRPQRLLYLAMNKPKGVVTTLKDELGRRTVTDLLPDLEATVKPVGRLDKDTEGLLLFTNDGDLAARLTHPRFGVWKTYVAVVDGVLKAADVEKLSKGLWIHLGEELGQGRKTAPAKVTLIYADDHKKQSGVEISIHEGAKHQVRLMLEAVGTHVRELKRTHFGPIPLGKLPPGACRMLSKIEEGKLQDAVAMAEPAPRRARPTKAPTTRKARSAAAGPRRGGGQPAEPPNRRRKDSTPEGPLPRRGEETTKPARKPRSAPSAPKGRPKSDAPRPRGGDAPPAGRGRSQPPTNDPRKRPPAGRSPGRPKSPAPRPPGRKKPKPRR